MGTRFAGSLAPKGPCPCGSGRAYANCHMPQDQVNLHQPDRFARQIELAEAKEVLRQRQQGMGKPIMSAVARGQRFVLVGNELISSSQFRTFHDFLLSYVRQKLGTEWGAKELLKPPEQQHPIVQWFTRLQDLQRQNQDGEGEIASAPMTGAIAAYLNLAYNLYLLQHNVALQERLLQRLRLAESFYPAFYETLVAGAFIRAGFDIALECEDDSTSSHCEFTATSKHTGAQFSVEAKLRRPGKTHSNVRQQLGAALEKKANHTRIIFIELSMPGKPDGRDVPQWMEEAIQSLENAERATAPEWVAAPPAYVVITNHPWVQDLDGIPPPHACAANGFKIRDFKFTRAPQTIEAIVKNREIHKDIYGLIESLVQYRGVPSTFDGEMPELAFSGERVNPLILGQHYDDIDGGDGPVGAVLESAVVVPEECAAMCVFLTDQGRKIVVRAPLTKDEMEAYKAHPDLFFGRYEPQPTPDDPASMFDWLMRTYSLSSREALLEFMRHWPGQEELQRLSQPELARKYCLGMAEATLRRLRGPTVSGR